MDIVNSLILGIIIIAWFVCFIKVLYVNKGKSNYTDITRFLVRVAIFGAISTILYVVPVLKFPVPFFPQFLEFHFDEIPALIAGFAYGPLSGFGVLLVKTLIKLPFTPSLTVGELSDFIYSLVFIVPAAYIYKKHHSFKGAIVGLIVGMVGQLIISLIINIYIMIPFYLFVFNMSEEQLLGICQIANPNIHDIKWGYGLFAVLPFNVLKDLVVIVITLIIYKATHKFIDKYQN